MENLKILEQFQEPEIEDFDGFIDHLETHHVNKNMHLRKARQKNKQRVLGHLHMAKFESKSKSLGYIVGPDNLECIYELYKENGNVKLFIREYDGDTKELKRVIKNLTKRLFGRASQESNASDDHYSNYKEGEFYLRRNKEGMAYSHPNIQNALRQGVITENFARKIKKWGFELINP